MAPPLTSSVMPAIKLNSSAARKTAAFFCLQRFIFFHYLFPLGME
jgi:hypothetical protein